MHLDELGTVREATSEIYAPRRQIGLVGLGQGCGGSLEPSERPYLPTRNDLTTARVMIVLAVVLPSLLTAVTPPPMTTTVIIPAFPAMMMPPPPPTATIVMITGVPDEFNNVCRADRIESVGGQGIRSVGCEP